MLPYRKNFWRPSVRILLDTHAWLWMISTPERFSKQALRMVEKTSVELVLSAASAWEISIKHGLGRIELPGDAEAVIPDLMLRSGVEALPITHTHALRAGALPAHHKDPFDRILVAQAQLEGIPILTADQEIPSYDVEVIPAA